METTLYKSKIGLLRITSKDKKLVSLDLNPVDTPVNMVSEFNNSVIIQLEEYFSNKRTEFDIPLDLSSDSDFNSSVWHELLSIPYGVTKTYKDVAIKIKKEKACRAVGSAIGKNPIPIIVPCHRVIRSNGELGGFSLGLDVKKMLMKIEQIEGLKKSC